MLTFKDFKDDAFVKVQEYTVNLCNVSSFKISPKRLIFNMSYTTLGKTGYSSDFIYVNEFSNFDIDNVVSNKYFQKNFIKIYNGTTDMYINKNCIGSYKYEADKNRYIINLNAVHTYDFENRQKVLAEFVYAYDIE